jgi:hypothetical protein
MHLLSSLYAENCVRMEPLRKQFHVVEAKSVSLHATEALGGGIAPTHSRTRH